MNRLGEKIKSIRIKNKLTQEAFAKLLGYNSKSTINKIEKGINEISFNKLLLLLDVFNLTFDELMDDINDYNYSNDDIKLLENNIILINNLKTNYHIVHSKSASECIRFATSELQNYLYKSSGFPIPIFSDKFVVL